MRPREVNSSPKATQRVHRGVNIGAPESGFWGCAPTSVACAALCGLCGYWPGGDKGGFSDGFREDVTGQSKGRMWSGKIFLWAQERKGGGFGKERYWWWGRLSVGRCLAWQESSISRARLSLLCRDRGCSQPLLCFFSYWLILTRPLLPLVFRTWVPVTLLTRLQLGQDASGLGELQTGWHFLRLGPDLPVQH